MAEEANNISLSEQKGGSSDFEVLDYLAQVGGYALGNQIRKATKLSKVKVYRQLHFLKKINAVEVAPGKSIFDFKGRRREAYRLRVV